MMLCNRQPQVAQGLPQQALFISLMSWLVSWAGLPAGVRSGSIQLRMLLASTRDIFFPWQMIKGHEGCQTM